MIYVSISTIPQRLKNLNEITKTKTDKYFIPTDDNFPFGTLLGSLLEKAAELKIEDEEVFTSFNFSEAFMGEYM